MNKEAKHDENNTFFYQKMKLADLIEKNYKLLPILSQLGFKLGFGEISVDEACRQHNISTESFLLICNIYSFANLDLSEKQLDKINIMDIVGFLKSSHRYYNSLIAKLSRKIMKLVSNCEPFQKKILVKFFNDYCVEVYNHFDYEDGIVFKYISELHEHKKMVNGYCIKTFEQNHGNIEEKFNDLKRIVLKYLPKNCDENIRYDVIYQIFNLGEDLKKHTFIENNVLIPLVAKLEKQWENQNIE